MHATDAGNCTSTPENLCVNEGTDGGDQVCCVFDSVNTCVVNDGTCNPSTVDCDLLLSDGTALFCPNNEQCCSTIPKTTAQPIPHPPKTDSDNMVLVIVYGTTVAVMLLLILTGLLLPLPTTTHKRE